MTAARDFAPARTLCGAATGKFSPDRGRPVTVAAGSDSPWGCERGGHAIPCPFLLCRAARLRRGEGARVRTEGGRPQGQRLAALPRADRRQRLRGEGHPG